MPIRPSQGVVLSEPGGALRGDVVTPGPQVVTNADGVFGFASYGAEASMYALSRGTGYVVQFPSGGAIAAIPFSVVTVDTCDASSLPQCEAESGVLTAQQNGLYEIGCQVLLTTPGAHVQLGIYTDLGYSGLPLFPVAPLTPFGNPAVGAAGTVWYRIAQKTYGYLSGGGAPSTDPEAPGFQRTISTVWLVSPANINVLSAPNRFRFGIRTDTVTGSVIGVNPRNTYCWMRQLRP